MVAYHYYNYLRVQNHRPQLQRRLLVVTHNLLRFTRYITFPQKLLPCAFAVYWLARSACPSLSLVVAAVRPGR